MESCVESNMDKKGRVWFRGCGEWISLHWNQNRNRRFANIYGKSWKHIWMHEVLGLKERKRRFRCEYDRTFYFPLGWVSKSIKRKMWTKTLQFECPYFPPLNVSNKVCSLQKFLQLRLQKMVSEFTKFLFNFLYFWRQPKNYLIHIENDTIFNVLTF